MTVRASSALDFIDDFLQGHNAKDGAYFRSICILLSYSFELLLKSVVVFTSEYNSKDELEKELRNLNHDLIKIAVQLGEDKLQRIGIIGVDRRSTPAFIGYIVNTTSGKQITVENFIDIRYDFTNDSLRDLPEDEEFRLWVEQTQMIYSKIKELHLS